jgi:hypothetical protein
MQVEAVNSIPVSPLSLLLSTCTNVNPATMALESSNNSEAGPSTFAPGPTPYHETSQYRNWRYSPGQLTTIRAELNTRSVEVFTRNGALEKVYPHLKR